jgi:hypothetical protein
MREESVMLTRSDSSCRGQAKSQLGSGTPVVIGAGPLQGMRGTVLSFAHDDWLVVLVRLGRGATPLELPPWWILVDDGVTDVAQPLLH